MDQLQVIRVVALLVVIFVAGIFTGRLTAPQKVQYVTLGPSGKVRNAETVLATLKTQLRLTPEQEPKFRVLLEELEGELLPHPPLSRERLEIVRRYFPRMKELLNAEQYPRFERHTRDIERRFESARRQRGENP